MNNEETKKALGECKKPRVTVDFTQKAVNELDLLADDMGTSKAEVIRRALVLLKLAVDQKKKGFDLFLKNEEKQVEREVLIV